MAEAIRLGLISVQDLRINMHVTKGTDELRVEFDALCCDGPAPHEDMPAPKEPQTVPTEEVRCNLWPPEPAPDSTLVCTLTKNCWLDKGHDGSCID